jgi:hypothetical protein
MLDAEAHSGWIRSKAVALLHEGSADEYLNFECRILNF